MKNVFARFRIAAGLLALVASFWGIAFVATAQDDEEFSLEKALEIANK